MADPESGHASTYAIELAPVTSPGVFTTIGQVMSDIGMGLTKGLTDITPHGETIDRQIPDGYAKRDPVTGTCNYIYTDTSHAGLLTLFQNATKFGLRYWGPSGASGTDEWIASGYLSTFKLADPNKSGSRTLQFTFTPTGPMKVNGAIYS